MQGDEPLISCIMPTRNRPQFVQQAIRLFQAQDYPNKELIIVDEHDGECGGVFGGVADKERHIRAITVSADRALFVGMKRNLAIAIADGAIICHWDDDDYYGPERLSKQVAPILAREADLSAMRMSYLLDGNAGTLWTCSDDTHRRCFKQDVHYGTLMYRASYWHAGTQFAACGVGEDRRFVHALLAQDARLARIVDPASFMYVLHGTNTTSDMRLVHPDGWDQVSWDGLIPVMDRAFYEGMAL
jgi:glycosyltransferase involved in cell wall biosynthesis